MDGNNGKGKEQKKREAEESAMVREAKRANKVHDKEAKKQSSAVFRSGKRKGQQCTVMCLMCIATKCLISGSTLLLLTTDSI